MSNQAEIDYEKQFQDDLAKATALSLEQEALDEYRRSKRYGSSTSTYKERSQQDTSISTATSYYARHRPGTINTSRGGSSTEATTPPISGPPSVPQRRHSEVVSGSAVVSLMHSKHELRSKTPPPPESDLISFASPTAKKPEHSTFEKLIEDLQNMKPINSSALMPFGPTAASHPSNIYRPGGINTVATGAAMYASPQYTAQVMPHNAAGMQLVPFTPPPLQQRVPLTQKELQKLYNMPAQQHAAYPQPHVSGGMGFTVPAATPSAIPYHAAYSQSASVGSTSAAYLHSYYPTPYGFQYGALPTTSSYRQPSGQCQQTAASNEHAAQIPKSHSASSVSHVSDTSKGATASATSSSISTSNLGRQTPPARKRTGIDLIDLSQEDDSRVSVLEAFDPLHQDDDDCVWKK